MKTVSTMLGIARSNAAMGSGLGAGRRNVRVHVELAGAIRALGEAHPTYGYRRIGIPSGFEIPQQRLADFIAP